jgi:acyl-CoA dehydrogenase
MQRRARHAVPLPQISEGDSMINLELPTALSNVETTMRNIGLSLFRPISRKYDKQEHDTPVELEVMRRGASSDPRNKSGSKRDPNEKRANQNGRAMQAVITTEALCYGDVGLLLSIPGQGLGNAAIGAAATMTWSPA